MSDITIPEAAVEAAARALDANFNPDHYPIMAAMFQDYARAALAAAAPHIAAQALEDFADAHRMPWTMFLRDDGSPVTVGDLMREVAAHYQIEADHG